MPYRKVYSEYDEKNGRHVTKYQSGSRGLTVTTYDTPRGGTKVRIKKRFDLLTDEPIVPEYKEFGTVAAAREYLNKEFDGIHESKISEVAPPDQESWVKKNKSRFKQEYGKKKGENILYATAWKKHNKMNEDNSFDYNVGDRVYLGFGALGGAGHYGTIEKIDGDSVYIRSQDNRVYKGPARYVSPDTREITPGTLDEAQSSIDNYSEIASPKRKCDDCKKNLATHKVGGRRLCKSCGISALERKKPVSETSYGQGAGFSNRGSVPSKYVTCPSCKGSCKSEHPADIDGSKGGIRPPCRECGGTGKVRKVNEETNPKPFSRKVSPEKYGWTPGTAKKESGFGIWTHPKYPGHLLYADMKKWIHSKYDPKKHEHVHIANGTKDKDMIQHISTYKPVKKKKVAEDYDSDMGLPEMIDFCSMCGNKVKHGRQICDECNDGMKSMMLDEDRTSGIAMKPFNKFAAEDKDKLGLVILGAGGDPKEWRDGIADLLKKDGIVKGKSPIFSEAFLLSGNVNGEQGRRDLVLIFSQTNKIVIGKLAMWRIQFGDASWIDDFITNHRRDYGPSRLKKVSGPKKIKQYFNEDELDEGFSEFPPELHDPEAEKNSMYCDMCGGYHAGECTDNRPDECPVCGRELVRNGICDNDECESNTEDFDPELDEDMLFSRDSEDGPVPDDYCEACSKDIANHECGHGILCDKCHHDIHGGAECDLDEGYETTGVPKISIPTLEQIEFKDILRLSGVNESGVTLFGRAIDHFHKAADDESEHIDAPDDSICGTCNQAKSKHAFGTLQCPHPKYTERPTHSLNVDQPDGKKYMNAKTFTPKITEASDVQYGRVKDIKDFIDDVDWANSPDEKVLDARAQLVDMSDGPNRPKKQINKFNKGDNAMTIKNEEENEGVNEDVARLTAKLSNRYKKYLGENEVKESFPNEEDPNEICVTCGKRHSLHSKEHCPEGKGKYSDNKMFKRKK